MIILISLLAMVLIGQIFMSLTLLSINDRLKIMESEDLFSFDTTNLEELITEIEAEEEMEGIKDLKKVH